MRGILRMFSVGWGSLCQRRLLTHEQGSFDFAQDDTILGWGQESGKTKGTSRLSPGSQVPQVPLSPGSPGSPQALRGGDAVNASVLLPLRSSLLLRLLLWLCVFGARNSFVMVSSKFFRASAPLRYSIFFGIDDVPRMSKVFEKILSVPR